MSSQSLDGNVAALAAVCAAGMLFGWGYFEALRRSVARYGSRKGRAASVALTAGRLLAAVALFGAAARLGALPLLVTLLGFLVARSLALRAARRAL